jgi:hypothetical protein
MYHQQLQGVPKNKKSSSGASRNKAMQSTHKLLNAKEQITTIVKEATPKKEKKVVIQTTPTITR